MGNPLFLQIGLGLLVLFFIFLTVMFTKTWRALHVTAAVLTFLGALFLCALAAMTAKTRLSWREEIDSLRQELAEAEEQGRLLLFGDVVLVDDPDPSVRSERERLARLILDRGRVWRNVQPGPYDVDSNTVVVSTVPPQPAGATPVPPEPNGIRPGSTLYVFKEIPIQMVDPADPDRRTMQQRVSAVYLGEYRVVDATDTQVTMQGALGPDPSQFRHIQDRAGNPTWTLYEVMPRDGHRIFSEEDSISKPLDNRPDQPIFGELDPDVITSIFRMATGRTLVAENPQPPADQMQQLADQLASEYLRDGQPARPTDDPEDIHVKIEFLQRHEVQVDSDDVSLGLDDPFFDPAGQAVSPRLRAGANVVFQPQEIAVFRKETADQLVAQGIAREIGPVYVRPLNDYEFEFSEINLRLIRRGEDIRRAQRDIASLEEAIGLGNDQIGVRTDERDKLAEDKGYVQDELDALNGLVSELQTQRSEVLTELTRLHQTNLILAAQLAEIQARLTEQIEQREADAETEVSQ